MLNSYCGLKEDVVVLRKMRINENVSLNRSASRLLVVLRKKLISYDKSCCKSIIIAITLRSSVLL